MLGDNVSSAEVAMTKIESNQRDSIFKAVQSAIDLVGGIDVSQGEKIIIKPNLGTCRPPSSGTTTDLRVVEAILNSIHRNGRNFKVYVVESDNADRNANESLERYIELKKAYDVELVNISNEVTNAVSLPNGKIFKKLKVPKTLQHYDYFISVANLKIHAMEVMSCVMKNQFGCIPDINKSKFHPYMSEVLYDLNEFYHPNLCIAGGVYGKEFNQDIYLKTGFITSRPKQIDLIVCGKDSVATDIACARIMGFDPRRIPYLEYAMKNKLSTAKPIVQMIGDIEAKNLGFQFIPYMRYLRPRVVYRLLRLYSLLTRKKKHLFC